MKFSAIAAVLSASTLTLAAPAAKEPLYTIETAPGETRKITEAQKWELFNVRSLTLLCLALD